MFDFPSRAHLWWTRKIVFARLGADIQTIRGARRIQTKSRTGSCADCIFEDISFIYNVFSMIIIEECFIARKTKCNVNKEASTVWTVVAAVAAAGAAAAAATAGQGQQQQQQGQQQQGQQQQGQQQQQQQQQQQGQQQGQQEQQQQGTAAATTTAKFSAPRNSSIRSFESFSLSLQ